MISAVDTNILLDVLVPGSTHGEASLAILDAASREGALIIGEAAYAELAASFKTGQDLTRFVEDTRLELVSTGVDALFQSGQRWGDYARSRLRGITCASCGSRSSPKCRRCGAEMRSRQHVLADFLVGAHALAHADRLVTRDRGYYETYFPDLPILAPSG